MEPGHDHFGEIAIHPVTPSRWADLRQLWWLVEPADVGMAPAGRSILDRGASHLVLFADTGLLPMGLAGSRGIRDPVGRRIGMDDKW